MAHRCFVRRRAADGLHPLDLTEVPPDGGGDTLFANMYLTYESLSEPMKTMLQGLTAVHDGKHVYERPGYRDDRQYPRSEHPIVPTHPVTGRQALFVNRVSVPLGPPTWEGRWRVKCPLLW